jgi:hypothetical protein
MQMYIIYLFIYLLFTVGFYFSNGQALKLPAFELYKISYIL